MIQVQIPGGQLVQAQVPQGVHPGQSFQIQVPQATFRPVAAPPQQPDAAIVQQLVSMGFSENGSKRAALAVGNSSADQAMEWVFAHMEDADFNDPPPPTPQPAAQQPPPASFRPVAAPPQQPDAAIVQQLVSMGFSENGSKRAALAVNNSSPDEAAEWVFAHMEDADFNDPLPPPGQQHGPIDDVPLDEDEQLAWALAASQEGQPKTAPRLAMAEAAEKEALLV
jgi:ubiquitin carboxyl-terminal hydrolase 5/13